MKEKSRGRPRTINRLIGIDNIYCKCGRRLITQYSIIDGSCGMCERRRRIKLEE